VRGGPGGAGGWAGSLYFVKVFLRILKKGRSAISDLSDFQRRKKKLIKKCFRTQKMTFVLLKMSQTYL